MTKISAQKFCNDPKEAKCVQFQGRKLRRSKFLRATGKHETLSRLFSENKIFIFTSAKTWNHIISRVFIVNVCRYTWLLRSDPLRLSLRTDTVNKHSFRRSCQRRQTTNENKWGQTSLSVFSKIGTSPLNEVICPQLWQHLNLALLVLTLLRLHLGAANPSIHPLVLKGWQQQRWKKIRSCNRSQAHSPALDCKCSPE